MKPENYNKVVQLIAEREMAIADSERVEQSDTVIFSKGGYGRIDFEIPVESPEVIKKFKEDILNLFKEKIKAIDDKLAEL